MQKRGPNPTIKDSYIFSILNKNGMIENTVKDFINKGTIVHPDKIEHELSYINKTFKYPAKNAVIETYKNGDIVPMVLPKGMNGKMPTCVPFILNKPNNEKGCKALVFIDNYAQQTVDGDITIDPKKLYCLLESAYFAVNGIPANIKMITIGSNIFAHIFTRVLNKKFSLNTDKNAFNKVIFLASKFFMIKHLNFKDDEMVFNYALKNCNSATAILMKEINDNFEDECFYSIDKFVQSLASYSHLFVSGFNKITVRDYVNSFHEMYGYSTVLALENLNYFIFVISSVVLGAYMNNQVVLEDIIDTSGAKFYLELY